MPKAKHHHTIKRAAASNRAAFTQPLPDDISGLATVFDAISGAAAAIIAIENQPRAGDTAVLAEWIDDLHGLKERIVVKMESITPKSSADAERKEAVLLRHAIDLGFSGAELCKVLAQAMTEAAPH